MGQNQPQRCPYDLYAEGISGNTFTTPRSHGTGNQRVWLYRIRPAIAMNTRFKPYYGNPFVTSNFQPQPYLHPGAGLPMLTAPPQPGTGASIGYNQTAGAGGNDLALRPNVDPAVNVPVERPVPNVLQWNPMRIPTVQEAKLDFIDGLRTMAGAGSVQMRDGLAYHLYVANSSMERRAFFNSDGDLMIFPQVGNLDIWTETGRLSVAVNELCVIPRGIRFSIAVTGPSRGFVLEVFNPGHFALPDLGPLGANHLAAPRDFLAPVAAFIDKDEPWEIVGKYLGNMSRYDMDHCPFDVVAWHGNYYAYKYDMAKFAVVGSISWDHTDPSLFTILTVPSAVP